MNMIDVQDKLKNLSEDQLVREMQAPSGMAPQFLVLSEITRRKRMRDSMSSQEAQPQTTVAEEAVAAAGVPQQGIASMAQAMAPRSSIAQNTGVSPVQRMAGGGYVQKMAPGGTVSSGVTGIAALMANPAARAYAEREAQRLGVTLDQYLREAMPAETRQSMMSLVGRQSLRDRMVGLEPPETLGMIPSQSDLDMRFRQSQRQEPIFPDSGFSQPAPTRLPMTTGRPIYETLAGRTGTLLPEDQVDLDLTMDDFRNQMRDFEQNYTTTTEDFTGPVKEFFGRPDETVRTFDPYTGKAVDVPTLGTQVRKAGNAVADLVSQIPAFDLSSGNPYSELSPDEMKALTDGSMSPEVADSLQSARLAMAEYGRGTSGSMSASAPAAATSRENAAAETAAPQGQPTKPSVTVSTSDVVGDGSSGTRTGDSATGSGSGVAAAVSGAPMSSYEQELMDAMQRAERRAEQDKWLALAQVGLGLMSSTQPTLGGALGEAGASGLEAFRSARNTAEEERLGLTKALYDIQASRQAALASQRAASAKASSGPSLSDLNSAIEMLTTESKSYDDAGNEITTRVPINPADAALVAQLEATRAAAIQGRFAPQM